MMEHAAKDGRPKIVTECTLPLTGAAACTGSSPTSPSSTSARDGLVLRELAPGTSVAEVRAATEPDLIETNDITEMCLALTTLTRPGPP